MSGLFHVKRLRLLALVAALSLLLSTVLLVQGDPEDDVHSVDADTFSRSALGHSAWRALLEATGVETLRDRSSETVWDPAESVVVIAEPEDDLPVGEPAWLLRIAAKQSDHLIVVLPKRSGFAHGRSRWVRSTSERRLGDAQWVLDSLDTGLTVTREGAGSVEIPATGIDGESLSLGVLNPQTVSGPRLETLIPWGSGTLVGRLRPDEGLLARREILIVADADIVANHGLHRADNAAFALDLIRLAYDGDPEVVVFDETVHAPLDEPSLFRRLTTFPLAAAFLQGLLALFATVWAGMVRFGAPLPPRRRLGAGRRTLLDNTADLLVLGGHGNRALRRYWDRTLREVAVAFHAPPDAREDELLAVAGRASRSRGARHSPDELADAVRRLSARPGRKRDAARAALHLARRIHRWKKDVLHGPTPDPRDR